MANTYYDSELTAEEIEQVLEAINGILTQANNGKVLAISNGKIEARSVQWGGGEPVLEPLSVTANGDYTPEAGVDGFDEVHVSVPNSYSASDEGKVVSNGALVAQTARASQITQNGTYDTTLNDEVTVNVSGGGSAVVQPLSVTQNGVYNPPSGVDGYAPVAVNVSGGSGIPVLTKSEWDALSIQQKQAYQLVGIRTNNTGYNQGILVYGENYNESAGLIPFSLLENIECAVSFSNFVSGEFSWSGYGTKSISSQAEFLRYENEDAVFFNAVTGNNLISIPLNGEYADFTIYVVAKGIVYAYGDVPIMGSHYSWSSGQMVNLYHRAGTTWRSSIYGSDADLIDTLGDYVAIAIRVSHSASNQMLASWFAHDGASRENVAFSRHANIFTFGTNYPGAAAYTTNLAVKFVGLIQIAESTPVILNNLANLASQFNLTT